MGCPLAMVWLGLAATVAMAESAERDEPPSAQLARLAEAEQGFALLEEGLVAALGVRKRQEQALVPGPPPPPKRVNEAAFEARPQACREAWQEEETTPSLLAQLEAALRSPAFAEWLQNRATSLAQDTPAELLEELLHPQPVSPQPAAPPRKHKKPRRLRAVTALPPLPEETDYAPPPR